MSVLENETETEAAIQTAYTNAYVHLSGFENGAVTLKFSFNAHYPGKQQIAGKKKGQAYLLSLSQEVIPVVQNSNHFLADLKLLSDL